MNLTSRIATAMIAAILFGSVAQFILSLPELPAWIHWLLEDLLTDGVFLVIGKIFVASLKVMVVPLVFVSLVCGVCHLKDQSSLGLLSLKTIGLYIITTGLAISLALFLGELLQPGSGVALTTNSQYTAPESTSLIQVLINIFPSNPIKAMAEGHMLQVIVFALLIGMAIGQAGEEGKRIGQTFNDWNQVLMTLVKMMMQLAPYGVFALLFSLFARQGLGTIGDLLVYMITVIAALMLHALIVYPLLMKLLSGLSPIIFLRKMRSTQLFAFSTASSNATLPITLRTVEERLGVKNRVAAFSIPMGATINMDGTAIMQGVATVFIAQAYGLDLAMMDYLLVIITAMLASIGTAGIPSVGLVTLAMVLQQVGLPVEGIALIIGVDRILDMIRTAVNVTGDAMVSVVVANSEQALNAEVFNSIQSEEK